MANVLSVVVLALLAGLFVFLAVRAGRSRRAWLKWPGMLLSGLLGLLFTAVTVVALLGFYKLNVPPHRYTVADVRVAMTPENIARGERFAYICVDCHASNGSLPLAGSDFLGHDPAAPPVGKLYGTNLTPGGPLKDWSDGEIIRAIREGVDRDGKPLVIMPSMAFRYLSDEDVQALVAYLRSQPAVENEYNKRDLNLLAALFIGLGQFPTSAQEPVVGPITAPPKGTPEYGEYLVTTTGCKDCHGENLDGVSFLGPGVNLTTIVPEWTEEQFISLFRTAADPVTGRAIDSAAMPIPSYNAALTDEELRDMYSFLNALPMVEAAP